MEIRIDDLRGPEIAELLTEHLRCMAEVSPPGSCHALNMERLREPGITFWTAWEGHELAGCGALRELNPHHGEIKSMRTAKPHLKKGVATRMLEHILSEARRRGYSRVSLETGAMPYFEHARQLYRKFGFQNCPAFDGYIENANSVFMSLELSMKVEGDYEITTDPSRHDISLIHEFLASSYWAQGIPREVVERSIQNSLAFGVFHGQRQVGFARVMTDYATFAYIGDVFIVPEHRGRGLSKLLIRGILSHPKLQGFRRILLATRDAHGLYSQCGFKPLAQPDQFMSIDNPNPYKPQTA